MLLAAHIEWVSVSHLRDFPPYIGYILNIYANNTAQSLVLWQQATLGLFLLWQDIYKPGHFPGTHEDHVPKCGVSLYVYFSHNGNLIVYIYLWTAYIKTYFSLGWFICFWIKKISVCLYLGFASCMIPLMVINVYYMCNSKITLVT